MTPPKTHKDPAFVSGFFGKILRASTIHGVKYIGLQNRHVSERIFWITAVLILVGFSIYLVCKVFIKYHDNPTIITLQPKATDISRIPFPAITLCNVNILKKKKVREIFEELQAEVDVYRMLGPDAGISEELFRLLVISEHLAHYCLAAPSFKRVLGLVDSKDFVTRIQQFLEASRNKGDTEDESFMIQDSQLSEALKRNLSIFGEQAAHRCGDMIVKCMWEGNDVNCSEIFVPIQTQRGSCCVFNMMPRFILRKMQGNESRFEVEMEKKKLSKHEIRDWKNFGKSGKVIDLEDVHEVHYPRHQKAGGRPYGLSFLVNPEVQKYGTCNANDAWGFKIFAHSPISYPNIMDYGAAIPPKSEVFVDIEPMLSTADDSLKSLPIDKRGCYFPSDRQAKLKSYKFYSAANCMDECIARLTYRNCSCVRYYMPRNSSQKLCGARKLACAEQVRVNISSSGRYGFCSKCLPACTELTYNTQISDFPLRQRNSSMQCVQMAYNKFDEKKEGDYSIVHMFIGMDKIHAKERKKLYDGSDLLANAGGLLSLTLGFSIASIVEIFYFATFRAFFHFQDRDKNKNRKNDDATRNDSSPRKRTNSWRKSSDVGENMANEYYDWANMSAYTKKINAKKGQQGKPMTRQRTPQFHLLAGDRQREEAPPPYSFLY